ncbi:hypothetical protein TWF694_003563 [Orbilia ellipsospora]|uniref:Uncharacterized protein n=1 Tax=Orbilia ellipsospora TaxID=2528407 RepID=A0AAV9WZW4_9PEZI
MPHYQGKRMQARFLQPLIREFNMPLRILKPILIRASNSSALTTKALEPLRRTARSQDISSLRGTEATINIELKNTVVYEVYRHQFKLCLRICRNLQVVNKQVVM